MTLSEFIAITRAGPAVIMVAKADMLAMLELRACMADNIRASQRLIKQGYPAHAEAVLNETLDVMGEQPMIRNRTIREWMQQARDMARQYGEVAIALAMMACASFAGAAAARWVFGP